jgi:serine/threonine-protein kinase
MKLDKGTTISHYRILSAIGKGGMGEVYLAQDTKLNRKVAIKFLSDEFSKDSEKLNRFIQEAQATSALNHPNILTVHEIDEFNSTHYIAAEFIEGETLRDLVAKKDSLPLNRILKIGIQVSEALVAAHTTGITHRDIKPENIMIRKDGYVKVLDFGLAKLTEEKASKFISLEGETKALVKTNPGMVMGTVSYMSPEQARGKETDERTDIWSLGVVLYEMLAGKVPFTGETVNHTIVAILENEPLDLENVQNALQRIVRKALTKDKEMRYQTAKDLLIDLKNLRREMELQGELERSVIPNRVGITESGSENKTRAYAAGSVENTNAEPDGLKTQDEAKVTNTSSLEYAVNQAKNNKSVSAIAGLILLLFVSAIAYFAFFAGQKDSIDSIAVMPFVNESGNADVEYLSDGMTETLISSLTEIPNLSVKARSTVFFYKGKHKTPKEIGEELGVDAVLLGRLVQRGENLKLSLELVDTATLDAIWSQSYDRKMSDLTTLQREIARNVSDKLRLKLTASEQEKIARSGTADSEAQQLYLKGLFHFNKRFGQRGGLQEMERAISFYQQAVGKDPNYALAYAGLAASYSLMPYLYPFANPAEYLPKGKEAAEKALKLDPDLAEAHAALGNVLLYSYDWKGAKRSYLKAIEVNPKYAKGHQWYADYLASEGRFEESLEKFDKALELDPFDLILHNSKIRVLLAAGKFDEAIVQARKFIELFPESWLGLRFLRDAYLGKGLEREAMEQHWTSMEKRGVDDDRIKLLKDIYKKGGLEGLKREAMARRLAEIKSIAEKDRNAFISYRWIHRAYADLKDKEKTLESLNRSYQQREPYLVDLKRLRSYYFLKDESEFQELLKKIGFPE